ncbi:hypothetical protein Tco_0877554 [Tanacetum coccineum]|uniref:Transposase (Putative), gypsy type n=1 Tax=Tanacetum coccineum TaxID=301880 RepID=A0ABQ5BWX2_9ASTR
MASSLGSARLWKTSSLSWWLWWGLGMTRHKAWMMIILKFNSVCSNWKSSKNALSDGGRAGSWDKSDLFQLLWFSIWWLIFGRKFNDLCLLDLISWRFCNVFCRWWRSISSLWRSFSDGERGGYSSIRLRVQLSITDIKSVLTLKALKLFCETYHIPDEVHPQLPSPNQTIHEMPTGISRNYTLDEDTYPQFLRDNDEEMDLLSFIRTADPTKVKVGKRQRAEGEPKLLDTTVGRVVSLLPVAPACASSELEASVEKLFDEGGSGSHAERDNSVSGGHGVDIPQVSVTTEIVAADAAPVQLKRQRKRKTVVSDAGEPSHPPKKLREDHGTSTGPSVAEVGVAALPTLLFITSSLSVTPEREDGNQSDFMDGANLRTITAPPMFVISSDSSHHSGANIAEAEVDSFARPFVPLMTMETTVTSTADPTTTTKERFVGPSIFGGGSSSGAEHIVGGFSGLTGSDFIVGDDGRTCREMVDEFAPPKFFASIRRMKHDQLFTEFNVGAARQMSLSAEVRMRAEFNIREKRRLCSLVEEKDSLLKARDEEIKSLKAQLLVKETEATEAIHLRAEASKFKVVEKSLQDEIKSLKERNNALEKEKGVLDVKVADLAATVKVREQEAADSDAMVTTIKLQADRLADQVRELETSSAGLQEKVAVYENCIKERLYPHPLTTIAGRRWLLTYGMQLVVFKFLNSPEYLSALGAAISKAIEKGMQNGLAAGITHGQEGRVLTDVAAFNPSAEDDFTSALQEVQNVNLSLLAELQSNKDASVEVVIDLLRLDEALAERLGLNDSQPHVDQLMVPVHHSPNQTVVGARALSLSLDVSHGRVQGIRENIANNRPALRDVFVSFSEPLSAAALEGTGGTSSVAPDTTTALSVTLASVRTIPPISMDDYEIAHAEDQGNAGADVDPFPNVDDAELIIS